MKIKIFLFFTVALLFVACSDDDSTVLPPVNTAPIFNDTAIDVDENRIQNEVIATLQATDNEPITYAIVSQNPSDAVSINSATGELKVTNADLFNYEIQQTISLQVSATDGVFTTNANITINIQDLQIPQNGIMSKYLFNNNANDTSGNGNNGTIIGNVISSTDRFNNPNSAYHFNEVGSGTNGKISINSFGNNEANFTISCWISAQQGFQIPQDFLYKGNEVNNGKSSNNNVALNGSTDYRLRINGTSGREFLALYRTSTGFNTVNSQETIPVSYQWSHVVLKVENNTIWSLYVNGALKATNTYSEANTWSNSNVTIGQYNFIGKIDDVYFYNRALNDQEINTLYNEYE